MDAGMIKLDAGVKIADLYKDQDIDADKLAKIEEMAADGVIDEDELQEIKNMGVDTTVLMDNSKKDVQAEPKTDADVAAKADEVKAKYCANLGNLQGDAYSSNNPELMALKEAMDDGLLKDLGAAGFSKSQILDIINKAFPSVGISNQGNGGYSLPYGHDEKSKEIYNQFQSQLFNVTTGTDSAELKEARAKLANLNGRIAANNAELARLEHEVDMLAIEIEERIDKAIEESEEIADDSRRDVQSTVSKHLNEYINAKGEMTYEEFESGLGKSLGRIEGNADSKLALVVLSMVRTERMMDTLGGYLNRMKGINANNAELAEQLKFTADEVKTAEETQVNQDQIDSDCNRCDPIGFTAPDGTRYDLFIDKDGDKDLSNEQEFLGAENGFEEITNLEKEHGNGDGTLSAEEMAKAGVKVVVTKPDGTQEIKDAAEVFKEGDSFDLNSYQKIDAEMDNGNALLGTFDVNFGGQELDDAGYQTLDTIEWLDANYDFSDKDNRIGRFAEDQTEFAEAKQIEDTRFTELDERYQQMKTDMNKAWHNLNVEGEDIRANIVDSAQKDAEATATRFDNIFKKTEKQVEVEEPEAEPQAEVEPEPEVDPDELDPDKEKDEE